MRPTKAGQIAKFHTPLSFEDPNQLYVVMEIKEDNERPRADIKALNNGHALSPINTVLLSDLIQTEVETADLMGKRVTIKSTVSLLASGVVLEINKQKVYLNQNRVNTGIETNIWLTVLDERGVRRTGTLFVK